MLLLQGRLKVDKWEDRATGAPRTAFKIVASSISRVRSNYPAAAAAAAGAGQYGEVSSADAGFGGGGGYEQAPWDPPTAAAPWDPPAQQQQPRVASGGQQQGGQQQRTMEELWMDYFEHPDSEWGSTNLGWGLATTTAAAAASCAALACPAPRHHQLTNLMPLRCHPAPTLPCPALQAGTTTAPTSAAPRPRISRRRKAGARVSECAARAGQHLRHLHDSSRPPCLLTCLP